ncbi:MAG: hypothetical protein MUC85_01120 [Anaerolineales bacterium]|jgi:hypothetical protein|nr:hypothetical protein [Anaerolineales bacterium]
MNVTPGLIVLFGSGEISPSGRKAWEAVLNRLPPSPKIALLETPAGFELNSERVISRVADFLEQRLQNHHPQVVTIPARQRGTPFSPDEPAVVEPLLTADAIFMGPGSPSYAVRQLNQSLAWYYLIARHRLGAALILASAATISFSCCALPVYEIFKVGEDLHWKNGLDFFGLYGLQLVFVPHWNNAEGGADLDTSRCFMGRSRFARLTEMLPENLTIVGLDENTALIMDPQSGECQVMGAGGVTLVHTGHMHTWSSRAPGMDGSGLEEIAEQRDAHVHHYQNGESFSLTEVGPFRPYHPEANLPTEVWQRAQQALLPEEEKLPSEPPSEVLELAARRQAAREARNWMESDALRAQIASLGWVVKDTKEGMVIEKLPGVDQ